MKNKIIFLIIFIYYENQVNAMDSKNNVPIARNTKEVILIINQELDTLVNKYEKIEERLNSVLNQSKLVGNLQTIIIIMLLSLAVVKLSELIIG